MKWLVYLLAAALVVQAIRHGLEASILEEKIKMLESYECPKIPPPPPSSVCVPQVITVEKQCAPCEPCDECERCQSWWELCVEDDQ